MAAVAAKAPELTTSPSLWATAEHSGGMPTKYEAYFRFAVEWRGAAIVADLTGDTYEARNETGPVWSSWRIITRRTDPGVTDTARAAITDACRPIALAWFETDEYQQERRRAHAELVRRTLRDERYDTQYPRRQLAALELDEADRERLTRACDVLDEFIELTTSA